MYRAITRLAMQRGIDPRDSDAVTRLAESTKLRIEGERVWADGQELTEGIYDADYAGALPIISAIPGVRKARVEEQPRMGESGVVMAGRRNGTAGFSRRGHKFVPRGRREGAGRRPRGQA